MPAAKVVMPMAVSPDKRFLVAAVRSKPYEAYTYAIDKRTGALKLVGKGPLAESYPYIAIDRTRALSAQRILRRAPGGREPDRQATARSASRCRRSRRRATRTRSSPTGPNKYVFVPHLGTDQIFQFVLDKKSGKLSVQHAARPCR